MLGGATLPFHKPEFFHQCTHGEDSYPLARGTALSFHSPGYFHQCTENKDIHPLARGAALSIISQLYFLLHCHICRQGVTKRCRLSLLANSALPYEPKCGEREGVAGFQPMSTAVHMGPNKLWRSNSIFNLYNYGSPLSVL